MEGGGGGGLGEGAGGGGRKGGGGVWGVRGGGGDGRGGGGAGEGDFELPPSNGSQTVGPAGASCNDFNGKRNFVKVTYLPQRETQNNSLFDCVYTVIIRCYNHLQIYIVLDWIHTHTHVRTHVWCYVVKHSDLGDNSIQNTTHDFVVRSDVII